MLISVTMLAAAAALAFATSVGYLFGRRAAAAPLSWRQRTSRIALGRRAVNLFLLIAARRVRRRFRAEPVVELFGLRILVPPALRRGSVARMRAYRGAPGW